MGRITLCTYGQAVRIHLSRVAPYRQLIFPYAGKYTPQVEAAIAKQLKDFLSSNWPSPVILHALDKPSTTKEFLSHRLESVSDLKVTLTTDVTKATSTLEVACNKNTVTMIPRELVVFNLEQETGERPHYAGGWSYYKLAGRMHPLPTNTVTEKHHGTL